MSGFVEWEEPPVWLSVAEAAAYMGVTDRTVHKFMNSGELVGFRVGRAYRTRHSDVVAYLESVKLKPGDLEHLMPAAYDGPRHIDLRAVEAG